MMLWSHGLHELLLRASLLPICSLHIQSGFQLKWRAAKLFPVLSGLSDDTSMPSVFSR